LKLIKSLYTLESELSDVLDIAGIEYHSCDYITNASVSKSLLDEVKKALEDY
jgi:hypothetical protein